MKVCFLGLENLSALSNEYHPQGIGGEEVQHTLLAKALVRRGHQSSMAVCDFGQEDGATWDGVKTFRTYRRKDGIPVLRFIHPRWTGVWAALKRADADVYYVSCAGMHLGLLAMFCKKYKRRLVFRVASDSDCEPNALLVKHWRDKKLYEYGLRHCDAILVQSITQQNAMLKNYNLRSAVAGMLVDSYEPTVSYHKRTCDVIWVNSIKPLKRPHLLIQLAQRMRHINFHMIGGPQQAYAEIYEHISAAAAALTNLKFYGLIPYRDIGPIYGHAKVYVNTSDTEGFPNSFLQAWIRGTPVVSFFDPDGIIKKRGLGYAVNSIDEMICAINVLTSDRDAFLEIESKCQTFMKTAYDEETILKPYIDTLFKETA